MQFQSDANLDDIVSDITFMTKVDLSEYPIGDRTRNANHWYFRAIQDVVKAVRDNQFYDASFATVADGDWTLNNEEGYATIDIQTGVRSYPLPTVNKPWIIFKVAYMRDGVTYFEALPYHIGQLKGNLSNTDIDSKMSQDNPQFRINGNNIVIGPTANADVPAGLKIWFLPEPVKFLTDDTTKLPQLNEVFHKIVSMGASYEYLRGKPKGNTLWGEIATLRQELRDFVTSFLDNADINAHPDIPNYA